MKIRVALLLLFGIFFHINSVSGECAWILWTQVVEMYAAEMRIEKSEWRIFHVAQTMLECRQELVSFIDREQRLENKPFTIPKDNTGSVYKPHANPRRGEPSSTTDHLLCLPDTVDPRERKQ